MTERKTVAGAYTEIANHERECALRYQRIDEKLDDVKTGLRWMIGLVVGGLVSLVGYFGHQVIGG